jgi:hypothetical protein
MKRIYTNLQKWNDYSTIEYICIINGNIAYSYKLSTFEDEYTDDVFLSDIYVQEKFRGKGYFNEIINSVVNKCKQNIYIHCLRDSTLVYKYIEFGFQFSHDVDNDFQCYLFKH